MVTSITGQQIPNTPEFALLLINIENIPTVYRTVICNVLHAARLCIARHWKSDKSPSLTEVQEIVSNIYLQEQDAGINIHPVYSRRDGTRGAGNFRHPGVNSIHMRVGERVGSGRGCRGVIIWIVSQIRVAQ